MRIDFLSFFDVQKMWPQIYRGSDNEGHPVICIPAKYKNPLKTWKDQTMNTSVWHIYFNVTQSFKVATRKWRLILLRCFCQNCPKQISSSRWFTIKQVCKTNSDVCHQPACDTDDICATIITRTLPYCSSTLVSRSQYSHDVWKCFFFSLPFIWKNTFPITVG